MYKYIRFNEPTHRKCNTRTNVSIENPLYVEWYIPLIDMTIEFCKRLVLY